MVNPNWTHEEERILAAHYPEHGSRWDGWETLLPNRTDNAIRRHAAVLMLTIAKRPAKPKPKLKPRSPLAKGQDPFEGEILRRMGEGATPTQIDKAMRWRPGRTRQILSERWERLNG